MLERLLNPGIGLARQLPLTIHNALLNRMENPEFFFHAELGEGPERKVIL